MLCKIAIFWWYYTMVHGQSMIRPEMQSVISTGNGTKENKPKNYKQYVLTNDLSLKLDEQRNADNELSTRNRMFQ